MKMILGYGWRWDVEIDIRYMLAWIDLDVYPAEAGTMTSKSYRTKKPLFSGL